MKQLKYIGILLYSFATTAYGMNNNDKITLISCDGRAFKDIPVSDANLSITLKHLIDDAGIDKPIPLPNITGIVLERILEIFQALNNQQKPLSRIPKERITKEMKKNIKHMQECYVYHVLSLLEKDPTLSEGFFVDFFLAVNYLDSTLLFNEMNNFLNEKMLSKDVYSFNKIPNALGIQLIYNLFSKYKNDEISNDIINQLGQAIIAQYKQNKKPLTFIQCLTCIKILNGSLTKEGMQLLPNECQIDDETYEILNEEDRTDNVFEAIKYNLIPIVQFYIKNKNILRLLNEKNESFLEYAVKCNNLKIVTLFFKKLKNEERDNDEEFSQTLESQYFQSLRYACDSDNLEIFKYLLEQSKCLNFSREKMLQKGFEYIIFSKNSANSTNILSRIFKELKNTEYLEGFLAEPAEQTEEGTPFFLSIVRWSNNPNIVNFFINKLKERKILEKHLIAKDWHKKTSFMRALRSGNMEIIKLIITELQNSEIMPETYLSEKDDWDVTVLMHAIESGNLEVITFVIEELKKINKYQEILEAINIHQESVLTYAIKSGILDIVKLIIEELKKIGKLRELFYLENTQEHENPFSIVIKRMHDGKETYEPIGDYLNDIEISLKQEGNQK